MSCISLIVPMFDDLTKISLTVRFFLLLEYSNSSIVNFPQTTWLGKSLYNLFLVTTLFSNALAIAKVLNTDPSS